MLYISYVLIYAVNLVLKNVNLFEFPDCFILDLLFMTIQFFSYFYIHIFLISWN